MTDSGINEALSQMAQHYKAELPEYGKMLLLSQKQRACLDDQEFDTTALEDLINERQELINGLESRNAEINARKQEICAVLGLESFTLSAVKDKVFGTGVADLEQIFTELTLLLSRIKDQDLINEEIMRGLIRETTQKLDQLQNAKTANKAYNTKALGSSGVFVDYSK